MESSFQFSNPVLTNLNFKVNDNFIKLDNKEITLNINMSVSIERSPDNNNARVSLRVDIGDQEGETPFYLQATESALFKWDENVEKGNIDILLNQNAPALLLSYLRPIVTQITAASPFIAYNIPFMNFKATR